MVFCVGLTGSIASGKSTVAEVFAQLNVPIINADKIAKELTAKGQPALQAIVTHYGQELLTTEGELNRRALREIIFTNSQERSWLEHLLHPLIRQAIKEQVASCTSIYCVVEIPLLVDKTLYPYIDRILLVTAPVETQITRIMQRDQCTKEQALTAIATQPDLKVRLQNADDLLINNVEVEQLKNQVMDLHQKYLLLARR